MLPFLQSSTTYTYSILPLCCLVRLQSTVRQMHWSTGLTHEIKSIHSNRRQMPTMLLTSAWYQSRDFTATLMISQFQPLILRTLQQAMQQPPNSVRDKSKLL